MSSTQLLISCVIFSYGERTDGVRTVFLVIPLSSVDLSIGEVLVHGSQATISIADRGSKTLNFFICEGSVYMYGIDLMSTAVKHYTLQEPSRI